MTSRPSTQTEGALLASLPDQSEGGAYYCDLNADYHQLLRLERKGLAGSSNRSDWWRTPAGAKVAQ